MTGCIAVLATVLAGCTGPGATATDRRPQEATLSAYVSGDWSSVTHTPYTSRSHNGSSIRLAFELTFPEDRVLTSPSLHVGSQTASDGYLWPLDGVDHEGEDLLDPLPLPAGTPVLYEAHVSPDCSAPESPPTILLTLPTSLAGGARLIERFVPDNPEVFAGVLTLACGTDLAFQVGGGSLGDGGEARVAFLVNNPGAVPVTVEVPALTRDGASWKAAMAAVPAGSYTMVELAGAGVRCGADQDVPWTTDRIRVTPEHAAAPLIGSWDC